MATLKELARLSRSSIRTVARVIHRNGYVGAKTRERIEKAIARLGYQPDLTARSLRTKRSCDVAVLVPAADEIHMDKLAAADPVLRQAGYRLHVFFLGQADPKEHAALFDRLMALKPAGILVLPALPASAQAWFKQAQHKALPHIHMDVGESGFPGVRIDRPQGVYEAVCHLIRQGRKRIAYVGPSKAKSLSRLEGYQRALGEAGLPAIHLEADPESPLALRRLGRSLSAHPEKIDAIQAYTDVAAMGLLAGLHDAGVAVPKQIAVVGFDDRRLAALAWPALSTVAQPNRDVGEAAARMLMDWMETGNAPDAEKRIPTRLVLRESG